MMDIDTHDYVRLYMGFSLEQYETFIKTKPEFKPLVDLIEQLIVRNKELEIKLYHPKFEDNLNLESD